MPKLETYVGSKINRFTVVEVLPAVKDQRRRFLCLCDCGESKVVLASNVIHGTSKSCGCLAKEVHSVGANRTHGYRKTPLYTVWANMVSRCTNKRNKDYSSYGGRGVTVCPEWLDAGNFIVWAKDKWHDNLQIDRIDNDKGYNPENCRFVDRETNSNNQRVRADNKLGVTGVFRRKDKYHAYIRSVRPQVNGQKHIGTYSTLEEALEARNKFILDNNLPHRIQELKNA